MKISLNEQIVELIYELAQRELVYPRIAAKGQRRQFELDYHVKRMEAARDTLIWLRDNEEKVRSAVSAA